MALTRESKFRGQRGRAKFVVALLTAVLTWMTTGLGVSPAAATTCPKAMVFGVRGSGELKIDDGGSGYGRPVGITVRDLLTKVPGAKGTPIEYKAVKIGYAGVLYGYAYKVSVATGVRALTKSVTNYARGACGARTPILLIGWSQGAHVVGDVFQGHLASDVKKRVRGVVLLADPRFRGSQKYGVNQGSHSHTAGGVNAEIGSLRTWSAADAPRVHSYCIQDDPVCNESLPRILFCQTNGDLCPHVHYQDWVFGNTLNTYTETAANWLASKVPGWKPPPPPPPASTSLTVGSLTLTYPHTAWGNIGYGASGPGQDSSADDLTNTAACTNCTTTPPSRTAAFMMVYDSSWCTGQGLGCLTYSSSDSVESIPNVAVGGRESDYGFSWRENGHNAYGMGWCWTAEHVCITYRRGVDVPLVVSPAVESVFARASWS